MNCCGGNRQDWRQWAARQSVSQMVASAPVELQNPITLLHTGTTSMVMRGAITGQTYLFGPKPAGLKVDERDVETLLATGYFVLPEK